MNNLNSELIARAKSAKSAEELIALAEENNVALTAEEAKTYFEQLHTNAAVSDDELDAVSGGGAICEFFDSILWPGSRVKMLDGSKCSYCSTEIGVVARNDYVLCAKCENCGSVIKSYIHINDVEKI